MPTIYQSPHNNVQEQIKDKNTKRKLWMLASSHAETELENAIKVGGDLRGVLIPATIDSTSFKHVAAYKNRARRT